MKIKANRAAFLTALTPLVHLLRYNSLIDEAVGLLEYKNRRFYCKSEDNACSTRAPKSFVGGVPSFVVKGFDLVQFLQRGTSEGVNVSITDRNVTLSSGRSRATFTQFDQKVSFDVPSKWSSMGESFANAFARASQCAARSYYRPILTAVHVAPDRMEASDSYQFLRMTGSFLKSEVLVPATSNKLIQSVSPTKYKVVDNRMFFANGMGTVGVCFLLGGDFPSMAPLDKELKSAVPMEFSKDIVEAIERCAVFVERNKFDEEKVVQVFIQKDLVSLDVESPSGNCHEEVTAKVPRKLVGCKFRVHPKLFASCLSESRRVLVSKKTIHIYEEGKLWFTSALVGERS